MSAAVDDAVDAGLPPLDRLRRRAERIGLVVHTEPHDRGTISYFIASTGRGGGVLPGHGCLLTLGDLDDALVRLEHTRRVRSS